MRPRKRDIVDLLNMMHKLATLAHNRVFTRRDWRDMGGSESQLATLLRKGVIARTGRDQYFPTKAGWDAIEGDK